MTRRLFPKPDSARIPLPDSASPMREYLDALSITRLHDICHIAGLDNGRIHLSLYGPGERERVRLVNNMMRYLNVSGPIPESHAKEKA